MNEPAGRFISRHAPQSFCPHLIEFSNRFFNSLTTEKTSTFQVLHHISHPIFYSVILSRLPSSTKSYFSWVSSFLSFYFSISSFILNYSLFYHLKLLSFGRVLGSLESITNLLCFNLLERKKTFCIIQYWTSFFCDFSIRMSIILSACLISYLNETLNALVKRLTWLFFIFLIKNLRFFSNKIQRLAFNLLVIICCIDPLCFVILFYLFLYFPLIQNFLVSFLTNIK